MVDFYDPFAARDSVTLQEMGTDVIPSTTGEVLDAEIGSAAAHGYGIRGMRATDRGARDQIARDAAAGLTTRMPARPLLDVETLKEKYAIPGGHLSFDQPMTEESARDLYEHKHAELVRQDIIARRNGGVATGAVARFGAGLIGGLTDPLGLAVGVIPILGAARAASLLGRGAVEAMGAAERAGVRAVSGGVSGGVGTAALQPLEYALTRSEREDLTMSQVLHNIAFGAALGGGLHVAGGAVVDRVSGRYASPITQRIDDLGYEHRREVLQGAVAQHLNDEPVNIASALDLADSVRAERELSRPGPAGAASGEPIAEVRQRQAQAISEMTPRAGPVSEATRAADDAAKVSRETLPDVEREIADMETALGLAPTARPAAGGERAAGAAAATAPGGMRGFHGSKHQDLSVVRSVNDDQQFDNATSRFGAFFAPSKEGAQKYAGEGGKIYETEIGIKNPYEMSWKEFNYFQTPNRSKADADGFTKAVPAEEWGVRADDLKSEAAALRQELEARGHDGVIVRRPNGQVYEIASFKDVPLNASPARRAEFAAPESPHPELFALREVDAEIEAATGRAAASERAAKCIIDGII